MRVSMRKVDIITDNISVMKFLKGCNYNEICITHIALYNGILEYAL